MRDGRQALATAGGGGVVRLFDPEGPTQVGEWLHGNGADVVGASTVRLRHNRTALVTVGSDRTVRAWDHTTGTPVGAPMSAHNSGVRALTSLQNADGRAFVVGGGEDGTVQLLLRLWEPETGELVHALPAGDRLHGRHQLPAPHERIRVRQVRRQETVLA
ncbi:WD40 repeat domain-containing protein, partial [Streptomyces decoyicus]|uniref:WD40 repeat domain-containing protein n=1 Tax=Streptomyces decoyicus TaxID=249567 RepID=UPI00346AC751